MKDVAIFAFSTSSSACFIDSTVLSIFETIPLETPLETDFPFPRIYKSYKYLCNNCIKELNEKLIAPLKY